MKWVLLIGLLYGSSVTTTTAEFDTKEACEYAKGKYVEWHSTYYGKFRGDNPYAMLECVPSKIDRTEIKPVGR